MPSSSSLADLPAEILEEIALNLDYEGITILRLTGHEVSSKISQGCFKARFFSQRVKATCADFQQLVDLTRPEWMGCALQHLEVVGVVPIPDEAGTTQHNNQGLVGLLVKALVQLRDNGRLRSISLSVHDTLKWSNPFYFHRSDHVWSCADDTATLVAQAVQIARIEIEGLALYGSIARCHLTFTRLPMLFGAIDVSKLTRLALAVSAPKRGDAEAEEHVADIFRPLGRCISQLHRLDDLDIRWHSLPPWFSSSSNLQSQQFLAELSALSMPSLSRFSLRGFHTTPHDLLALLGGQSRLRNLSLEWLMLVSGTFEAVFRFISGSLELDALYLNDLWESCLVQFVGATGELHFPTSGYPSWIDKKGAETRQRLVYQLSPGGGLQTIEHSNWRRQRNSMYGPLE